MIEEITEAFADLIERAFGFLQTRDVAEDDDLFGASVQMAARLCDGAGTDGIMITNMLKDLLEQQGRDPKL